MRGIVLLALGGGLIWAGVSYKASDGHAIDSQEGSVVLETPGSGDGQSPMLDSGLDPGFDSGFDSGRDAREAPLENVGDAQTGGAPSQGTQQVSVAGPGGDRVDTRPAGGLREEGSEVNASFDSASAGRDQGESTDLHRRSQAEPPARPKTSLASASSSLVLGLTLFEAWVSGDPTALENLLNHESHPPSPQNHDLAVAFWEALTAEGAAAGVPSQGLELRPIHRALLNAVPSVLAGKPVPGVDVSRDPMARSMRMALLMESMEQAALMGHPPAVASSASELLQLEVNAPWAPHRELLQSWMASLNAAQEQHRLHPEGDWPHLPYMVESGDHLVGIRKKFLREYPQMRLCVGLIRWVNAVGKHIQPDQTLRIPTDTPNVQVYLDARVLLYRHGEEVVRAWEIGIGKIGHDTPVGEFVVGEKLVDPSWMRVGEQDVPFGDPANPLGTRWIAWNQGGKNSSFGMHGTWEPEGVGDRVSQGCVRMRNPDVEELFELLPSGSTVRVHP